MTILPPGMLNCATDTVTLSATVNPAGASVQWTASGGGTIASGQNTLTPKVISAGMYTLHITNTTNGCTASNSVTVTSDHTHPVAFTGPPDTITCQTSHITLSGNGSSTGPTMIYLWTTSAGGNIVSGADSLAPVVNSAGVYTLLVTNSFNFCTATASVSIAADTNVVVAIANAPDTMNCMVPSVVLNANGSTSGASITYLWTTSNGHLVSGNLTPTPTSDAPGTYQLLLTNTANGCTATDLAIVERDTTGPKMQISPPGLLTCAVPTQTIQAQNLSLPGNFTYQWTTTGGDITAGASTLTPTVDAPGTYTLTVNNLHNGCKSIYSTDVQQQAGVPVATIAPPVTLDCTTHQETLNTAGSSTGANYQYNWSTTGGHFTSPTNTPSPSADMPGLYALTITNASNGCTTTASVQISIDTAAPKITIQQPVTLTCLLPEQTLQSLNGSLSGNFTYQWTAMSNGHIVSGDQTLTPLVSSAGIYQISVTNTDNHCTTVLTVAVPNNLATPKLNATAPDTLTCKHPSVSLLLTNLSLPGNFSYAWTASGGGHLASGSATLSPTVDAPGDYDVIATNLDNGCTTDLTTSVVIDTASPVVLVTSPGTITCAVKTLTIQAQNTSLPGQFSYAWTAANGGILQSGNTTLNPVISAGGNYNLLTTNNVNGCTATVSTSALQNTTPPLADAGANDTLSCSLNSLPLHGTGSGNGPVTYLWTASNGGHILSGATTLTPSVDAAGTYSLAVTNTTNGCTTSDIVQIFNDVNAPVANAGNAATLTCTVHQTTLHATVTNGPGISFVWSTSGTGHIASGGNTLMPVVDAPGPYQIVVTNAVNGCTTLSSVTVPQDIMPPVVQTGTPGTLSCAVHSLPISSTATAANGGALSYVWTGPGVVSGGNSLTPTINLPGAYSISVTNAANGCTASAALSVGIDTLSPTVSATAPPVLTCIITTGQLTGLVTQPTNGFTSAWTTTNGHLVSGANTLTPVVDKPGLYTVTILNQQNGCTATASATATQNTTPPIAIAGAPGLLTCTNTQVGLNGVGSSGGTGFIYAWTATNGGHILSGANTLTPSIDASGTYSLTVTDTGNGCTASSVTAATSNTTPPTLDIAPPEVLSCIIKKTTLSGTVSQPATGYTVSWATLNGHLVSGQTTLNPVADQPGLYTLTVVNQQNGCTSSLQTTITQNIAPPAVDAGPTAQLNCIQPEVNLHGTSSTAGGLSWSWSTANGHLNGAANTAQPEVDQPGLYQLTLTSLINGCTATDTVSVSEIPLPAFTPSDVQPTCLAPKGSIEFGPVTGGSGPFMYSIDDGLTFKSSHAFSNLAAGHYFLVVKDSYGCTATAQVYLQAPIYPIIDLTKLFVIDLGESVQFKPIFNIPLNQIQSILWTPADSLSCSVCPDPVANPVHLTKYTLSIKDIHQCTAQASVTVEVTKIRTLYAPNVFSPNKDGRNDRFTLYGKGVRDVRVMRIFDRWGSELFFAEHLPLNQESSGWDGTFRGADLNPGVFVWEALVEFLDGDVEVLSGDVTIVR
jgi:gliding motility-associated-like protein